MMKPLVRYILSSILRSQLQLFSFLFSLLLKFRTLHALFSNFLTAVLDG